VSSTLNGAQRQRVPLAHQLGFPPIQDVRRVIAEVLSDGRGRPATEIRHDAARRFGLSASLFGAWTNWHAHGLKTSQNEWGDPELGLIVKDKASGLYRITATGRKLVRETSLPAGALRGEAADAVEAFEILAGKREGRKRGSARPFRLSVEERTALERHAVEAATTYFEEQGYIVDNVGATEPYDLCCFNDRGELHVEVKGTETDGSNIPLTSNEVLHARKHRPVALFVLANIKVSTRNGKVSCRGGEPQVHHPWRIDKEGELRPVGYVYARHT
jgi:hypothetical protein